MAETCNSPHAHAVGSSPEMLVQVYNREVTTHPIAGTRRRGKTPEEDDALMTELLGNRNSSSSEEREREEIDGLVLIIIDTLHTS